MKKAKLLAVLSFAGIAGSLLAGCSPVEPKPQEHVHSYSELHSAVAATCTEAGKKAYYDCTGCDKVFDENKNETTADALVVAALGHNLEHHEETASTCVEHGHVEYFECSVCHDKFSDAEGKNPISETEKALAAHSGVKQDGKAPTCTKPGWKEYYQCSECKAYFEDLACTKVIEHIAPWKDEGGAGYLAAVGHDMAHIDGDPATCKEDGYKECYFCEECGKYYEDEAGSKLIGDEAAWEAWIVGEGKLAKEDAQHIPGEKQQINRVEPTCTEDGSYDEVIYCTYCGELISSEHKIIEATGHLDVEPIDGLDPTCTAAGYKACYYCNDCKTYFEDQEGTKKIEDLDAWRGEGGNGYRAPVAHTAQFVEGLAATCSEAGYKSCWQCEDCDAYFEDEECTKVIEHIAAWRDSGDGRIAPEGHAKYLTEIEEVPATCEGTGVHAYFECECCGKLFSDNAAQNEIEDLDVWKEGDGLIEPAGHAETLKHYDGTAETCTTAGNDEYWQCEKCGLFFSDSTASEATKIGDAEALAAWKAGDGKVDPHAHNYGTLIEQQDKTRTTDGVKAHYQCSECNGLFDESFAATTAEELAIKSQYRFEAESEEVVIPFHADITETVIADIKMDAKDTFTWVGFSYRGAGDWARVPYVKVFYDGRLDQESGTMNLSGVSVLGITDDGYVRVAFDLTNMVHEGTIPYITHMVLPSWSRGAGVIDLYPVGHEDIAAGKKFVHGTQTAVDLTAVSTGNLVFDITFLSNADDAQCRLNLYNGWSSAKDYYLKLNQPSRYKDLPAWLTVEEVVKTSGVLGNRFRLTIDVAKFVEVTGIAQINMFAIESATNYDVVVNVNPTDSVDSYMTLTKGNSIALKDPVTFNDKTILSFDYSIPNDKDPDTATDFILAASNNNEYIGNYGLTQTGLSSSYNGITSEELGNGWVRVNIRLNATNRCSAGWKTPAEKEITGVKNITLHGSWGDGSDVLFRNINIHEEDVIVEVTGNKTLVAGPGVFKEISYEEMQGKFLYFEFKYEGGDTTSDAFELSLQNDNAGGWSNVSGALDIFGNMTGNTGGKPSIVIGDAGNGWKSFTVNVADFNGSGADKTSVNLIYITKTGSASKLTINLSSLTFKDVVTEYTSTRSVLGFALPVENWKTSTAKIVMDIEMIDGSAGQRNIYSLMNSSGQAVGWFVYRPGTGAINSWNGSAEGAALSNTSAVNKGTNRYTITVPLAEIPVATNFDGTESVVKLSWTTKFATFRVYSMSVVR